MGGRGGNSGLGAAQNSKSSKWHYPGFQESTQKAEQRFAQLQRDANKFSANGINRRVSEIVRYIDGVSNNITKELSSSSAEKGDEKVLYAERRKLRALRKKVLNYGSK